MIHSFDTDVAKKYGMVEAVLINNFQFWIATNKADKKHFHDDRYWTYSTKHALQEKFPYLTYDQIRRALERLIKKGVILTGNYNEKPMDRTLWYSFTDEFESIWQKSLMEKAKLPNPSGTNAQAIPYNRTDNDTDNIVEDNSSRIINNTSNNSSSTQRKKKKEVDLSFCGIEYLDMMERWLAFHKEIGKPYTQTGAEGAYRRLLKLSNQDARVADEIVEQSISNNWQGLFELKQQQKHQGNGNTQSSGGFFCQLAETIYPTGGVS